MDVWQFTFPIGKHLALALCLALAFAGGEAAAQGKKKVAAPWVGKTAEGKPCTGGQPTSGPFDYLLRRQLVGELQVVEEHHFDSNVENLIKGISTEPMGDIDYTLRSFPNHHRALNSAMKFRLRHKNFPPKSKGRPAECYLQRAIKFSPKDPVPYGMLGYTFHKLGKPELALAPYRTALEMSPGDMMLKYNLALALTDLERYKAARVHAEEVYAAGFPLPALKRRLLEAGHWEGATVPPRESRTAKAPKDQKAAKKLSKEDYVARALANQKAEEAGATDPAEGEAGLSKKEKFAAAIAAQQAREAEAGAPAAAEKPPASTNEDGTPLSNKEKYAAAIAAALKERGEQPPASDKPLSPKEKFAAAVAAKAMKDKAAEPKLSDVDPETRKEQFAAKLAAKGLLKTEEDAEEATADEEEADAGEQVQEEIGEPTSP